LYCKNRQCTRTKKNASENGDRELVKEGDMRGSSHPSAATANGTTNHWSPTSFQLVENKGGVKSSAHSVDTNSPSRNITQDIQVASRNIQSVRVIKR